MRFDPQHEAVVRVRLMLERISTRYRPDIILPLCNYADEETFNFLRPKPGWTFHQWQAVNLEVASQLRAAGFNVKLVRLKMAAYIHWLAKFHLKNSPQNRAQYVFWLIAPNNAKPELLPD